MIGTFAIVDATRGLLAGADVAQMAQACGRQLREHVAPAWLLAPPTVQVYSLPELLTPPGAWIVRLVRSEGDLDLGWHTAAGTLPFGVVEVAPILAAGGGALVGHGPDAPSVSAVLSHELCETLVDPEADSWEPGPGGVDYALEVCDPVQGSSYSLDGVDLSDWVWPQWFDATVHGTPTAGGLLLDAFEIAPGGYALQRARDGSTTEVFGAVPPPAWRLGGPRAQLRKGGAR